MAWCSTTAPTALPRRSAATSPGNAALANGAASVILNEVVGSSRTVLNGATEIAGQRAALIVANPNGISVDGGSVLNASRVTLTTGTPTLTSGGAVSGFVVAGGDIAIGGGGSTPARWTRSSCCRAP
ncbi:two-partner secretion domain-containing protein [Cupriavidus basilensis]